MRLRDVVTKSLSLSRFVVVAQFAAFSEKVEVEVVVAKNLSLSSFFLVAECAAFSEKVEAEGYRNEEP